MRPLLASALILASCGLAPGFAVADNDGHVVARIHDCPALATSENGEALGAFAVDVARTTSIPLADVRAVLADWDVRCVEDHEQDVLCADALRDEGDPRECTTRWQPGRMPDTIISTDVADADLLGFAKHGALHAVLMVKRHDETHDARAWVALGLR